MTDTTKREFKKRVGKNIQKLRKEAGYTSAKAFAAEIGFNPNTYTQYEQGISSFNYEQAWIMADALHCSMDELGGREWQKSALGDDERKLVADYRDAHDYFKPEISDFAERTAARHPKNEAPGNPRRQVDKPA